MAALHELASTMSIPQDHKEWTGDHYFGRVFVNLGKAAEVYLGPENQIDLEPDGLNRDEIMKAALTSAAVWCLEWAHVKGWRVAESFGLKMPWEKLGLLIMVGRAADGITTAHWSSIHSNPQLANQGLNSTLSYIEDYFRFRGWSLEEEASRNLNSRNNGASIQLLPTTGI